MPLPLIFIQLPTEKLTPREIEILTLTAYGKTREEIARILAIKSTTVKEHMKRSFEKLNVSNNTHASTVALALGLITPYRVERPDCFPCGVPHMEDAQKKKSFVLRNTLTTNKERKNG